MCKENTMNDFKHNIILTHDQMIAAYGDPGYSDFYECGEYQDF